ncbi:hypothetical protein U9M48_009022, partial [Paspalum notatum var. saurae]
MAPPLSRHLMLLALLLCAGASADTIDDGGDRLPSQPHYARIFSFGDSLTDTGNALRILGSQATVSRPPYGETFFGHPNGRASDGRIMIDFIAEALGVPQLTPYLAGKTAADFERGVNLAVGGGTALDPAFFESRGLLPFLPVSLRNQTSWFHNVLQVLGTERRNVTASSLFIVGEIGINDYLIGIIGNRTLAEMKSTFLPPIIGAIHSAVTDVIAAGARTVVVPGSIPIGCEPAMLMFYQGQLDAAGYDPETGCITWLNDFARLHNRALRNMIRGLRRAHPATSIVYADLYRPVTNLIVSPGRYGFRDMPLDVCCGGGGGGGAYHFEVSCGAAGTKTCPDPSAYISWDGVHFTEAANRQIACSVIQSLWPTKQEAGCR